MTTAINHSITNVIESSEVATASGFKGKLTEWKKVQMNTPESPDGGGNDLDEISDAEKLVTEKL